MQEGMKNYNKPGNDGVTKAWNTVQRDVSGHPSSGMTTTKTFKACFLVTHVIIDRDAGDFDLDFWHEGRP